MSIKFSILIACCGVFFIACSGSNKQSANEQSANSTKIESIEDVVLRDSVTILKYNNQTDTIKFPVINPQFAELGKSVSPEAVLGERLFDIKDQYAGCGCGYTSLKYNTSFFNSKIISLSFESVFAGPYSSETLIYQNFDIRSGKLYHLSDQLNDEGQVFVLRKYKDVLQQRLEIASETHHDDAYQNAYDKIASNINDLTFDALNDNYLFKDDSVIVKTEPILPHAILAWEINRKLGFSLEELKVFRKTNASI